MVLIETIDQKTKIHTPRPRGQKFENPRCKETHRKEDFKTHSKRLRDFEIGAKIPETLNFPGTFATPSTELVLS